MTAAYSFGAVERRTYPRGSWAASSAIALLGPTRFYEFAEGGKNAHFPLGQQLEFRIEKGHILLQARGKERKYIVTEVGEKGEQAPKKP